MTDAVESEPVRLALDIADPVLAERLAGLLGGLSGLRLVAPGEADVVVTASPIMVRDGADPLLTPRELEVVTLLAEGASNKTIARRLGISVHTVKFHVGSLLDKLDAVGRTDALAQAARRGVIEL